MGKKEKEEQYRPPSMTAVKRCKCPHGNQDRRYGKQMRVHNRTNQKEDKSRQGWRCTVCGSVKD